MDKKIKILIYDSSWQENFYSKKINKRIIFLNLYRIIELNIIFLLKKKYRKKIIKIKKFSRISKLKYEEINKLFINS